MDRFKDRSGLAGPATWEAGTYPDGQAEYPVAGVSWYEAAAFAEFAGKNLPTVSRWYTGRGANAEPLHRSESATWDAPGRGTGWQLSGRRAAWHLRHGRKRCASGAGTTPLQTGRGFIPGGGWNDLADTFSNERNQATALRSVGHGNGFRCIKYLNETQNEATSARTISISFRDLLKERPASENEVDAFLCGQYTLIGPPPTKRPSGRTRARNCGRREFVSFDAASGNNQMLALLFLPKGVTPAYQVVFMWPGGSGVSIRRRRRADCDAVRLHRQERPGGVDVPCFEEHL